MRWALTTPKLNYSRRGGGTSLDPHVTTDWDLGQCQNVSMRPVACVNHVTLSENQPITVREMVKNIVDALS